MLKLVRSPRSKVAVAIVVMALAVVESRLVLAQDQSVGVKVADLKSDSPLIQEVVYKNAQHVSQENLEMLSKIHKGMPLDTVVNLLACQEIQNHLKDKGHYWARVSLEEGNKLTDKRVVFSIDEGPIVRIQSTTFAGNNRISTATLQKLIGARESIFSETGLQKDVKKLEFYYKVAGYHDVRIRRELSFGKDRSQAEVIFHVDEDPSIGGFNMEIVPNLMPEAGRGAFGGGGIGGSRN